MSLKCLTSLSKHNYKDLTVCLITLNTNVIYYQNCVVVVFVLVFNGLFCSCSFSDSTELRRNEDRKIYKGSKKLQKTENTWLMLGMYLCTCVKEMGGGGGGWCGVQMDVVLQSLTVTLLNIQSA